MLGVHIFEYTCVCVCVCLLCVVCTCMCVVCMCICVCACACVYLWLHSLNVCVCVYVCVCVCVDNLITLITDKYVITSCMYICEKIGTTWYLRTKNVNEKVHNNMHAFLAPPIHFSRRVMWAVSSWWVFRTDFVLRAFHKVTCNFVSLSQAVPVFILEEIYMSW